MIESLRFSDTLTYSIIMLNTDLHNPAIHPKIAPNDYVASCRRCVPLVAMPEASLLEIYDSILREPLQIAPSVATVDSIVRAGFAYSNKTHAR